MSIIYREPGIYDISSKEYHADNTAISRSMLMQFKRSPLHYWYNYIKPQKTECTSTDAMIFGNAVHTMLLEPEKFYETYFVLEKLDLRKASDKEKHAELLELNKGKIALKREEYEKIISMKEAFINHPKASKIIHQGKIEQSFFWEDNDTGMLCKARPDIYKGNIIIDLKTTMDASELSFRSSTYKYGYYLQAAMAQEAFKALNEEEMDSFIFIAIEKEPPYAIAIYIIDQASIDKGVKEFKQLLASLKECMEKDEWPSYEEKFLTLVA